MILILSELVSAILQITLFSLIPFIFFLFRKARYISFTEYVGLKRTTKRAVIASVGVSILIVASGVGITLLNDGWKQALLSPNSVTGKIRALGLNPTSVTVLLITAWLKTALSEEILFRGFLARQLVRKFGLRIGNAIQALIFGIVHLLLFGLLIKIALLPLVMIFVFSTTAGWIIGYVKETQANRSIIPGWIAHGLGNSISYAIIAFYL